MLKFGLTHAFCRRGFGVCNKIVRNFQHSKSFQMSPHCSIVVDSRSSEKLNLKISSAWQDHIVITEEYPDSDEFSGNNNNSFVVVHDKEENMLIITDNEHNVRSDALRLIIPELCDSLFIYSQDLNLNTKHKIQCNRMDLQAKHCSIVFNDKVRGMDIGICSEGGSLKVDRSLEGNRVHVNMNGATSAALCSESDISAKMVHADNLDILSHGNVSIDSLYCHRASIQTQLNRGVEHEKRCPKNGNVLINQSHGALNIYTNNGDCALNSCNGSAHIRTMCGNITFHIQQVSPQFGLNSEHPLIQKASLATKGSSVLESSEPVHGLEIDDSTNTTQLGYVLTTHDGNIQGTFAKELLLENQLLLDMRCSNMERENPILVDANRGLHCTNIYNTRHRKQVVLIGLDDNLGFQTRSIGVGKINKQSANRQALHKFTGIENNSTSDVAEKERGRTVMTYPIKLSSSDGIHIKNAISWKDKILEKYQQR